MSTPEPMPAVKIEQQFFYIALIAEAIRSDELEVLLGALAQFGQYMVTHYPDAHNLEEYQKALALSPQKIPRRLIDIVISARNQLFADSPDVERESQHWHILLNHLTIGAHCLLSKLSPELQSQRTEKDTTYGDAVNTTQKYIAELLTSPKHPMPTILLDVDETAALSAALLGEPRGGYRYNDALFNALRRAGVQNIFLFTNYDSRGALGVANVDDPTPSRLLLIKLLLKRGFYVHGVITHLDRFYNQGCGQYYLDCIFPFEQQLLIDPNHNLPKSAEFAKSIELTNALTAALHDAKPGHVITKGGAYNYLTAQLSRSMLENGFIFYDDRRCYLEEVAQAHGNQTWPLKTIECRADTTEEDYAAELQKMIHCHGHEKSQRQQALTTESTRRVSFFYERDSTKIARLIDFAEQGHGLSLMQLAARLHDGSGLSHDLAASKILYQLAIVQVESKEQRAQAIAALEKVTIAIERCYQGVIFDKDPRIQADSWLAKLRESIAWQHDAIASYRLGLSFQAIAAGFTATEQPAVRISQYQYTAAKLFCQALVYFRTYPPINAEEKQMQAESFNLLRQLLNEISDDSLRDRLFKEADAWGITSVSKTLNEIRKEMSSGQSKEVVRDLQARSDQQIIKLLITELGEINNTVMDRINMQKTGARSTSRDPFVRGLSFYLFSLLDDHVEQKKFLEDLQPLLRIKELRPIIATVRKHIAEYNECANQPRPPRQGPVSGRS